jgi:plasmid replication initiation protein
VHKEISDFKFQISEGRGREGRKTGDFRFQKEKAGEGRKTGDFRFQISDFRRARQERPENRRFQISNFRFQKGEAG